MSPGTRSSRSGRIPWVTVVVLGGVMAYADGFIVTAVQGAVGAIERTGEATVTWLSTSTLTLPAFLLAVWGGLVIVRRRLGRLRGRPLGVLAGVLVVAAAGTLVGTVVLLISTAYDYHLQSQLLQTLNGAGHAHSGASAEQETLAADLRGARLAARFLLLANAVIVGWVTAMRGGRLDVGSARPARPSADGGHRLAEHPCQDGGRVADTAAAAPGHVLVGAHQQQVGPVARTQPRQVAEVDELHRRLAPGGRVEQRGRIDLRCEAHQREPGAVEQVVD
jgi:hypothetical protein